MADVAERLCTMANSIWLLPTLKCHGLWERINKELVKQMLVKAGREPEPSTAIIDSQSVKKRQDSRWHWLPLGGAFAVAYPAFC
jgi:hypothetical protein